MACIVADSYRNTTFFLHRLRNDLDLQLLFRVNLFEPTALIFQLFHPHHHQRIHATVFAPPLTYKSRPNSSHAHDKAPALACRLNLLQDIDDLTSGKA